MSEAVVQTFQPDANAPNRVDAASSQAGKPDLRPFHVQLLLADLFPANLLAAIGLPSLFSLRRPTITFVKLAAMLICKVGPGKMAPVPTAARLRLTLQWSHEHGETPLAVQEFSLQF
jgi:hypothetical protein